MLQYDRLFHRNRGRGKRIVWNRMPPPEGDRSFSDRYVYDDEIELAVNVALATGRPLLVRGEPGSGKSSLARSVASKCNWNYCDEVITSRSNARDLQWRFDAIRRLNDAQAGQLAKKSDEDLEREEKAARTICPYIDPGALWWAFDRETAQRRGATSRFAELVSSPAYPGIDREAEQTVVLVDEIDKADPDLPNDLLVTLGSLTFRVDDLDLEIQHSGPRPPFVVITTNRERSLPQAFLRRCVVLDLPPATGSRLREIAHAHFPELEEGLFDGVNAKYEQLRSVAENQGVRPPGIAEFLDALRSCIQLGVEDARHGAWAEVLHATLWKHEKAVLKP